MSELKSLAHSEQFQTGIGVAINREMNVWDNRYITRKKVSAWTGVQFAGITGAKWDNAAEIPVQKMRPMTAKEIAMLPRGTAFVRKDGVAVFFNPTIHERNTVIVFTGSCEIQDVSGYRLPTDPDDMEPRKFEVEAVTI